MSLLEARTAAISRDSRARRPADAADDQARRARPRQQAQQHNAALQKLAQQAETQAAKIALNQWVLPIDGYHLTARFGECSGLWSHCHTGLDFAAPSGTPIHAVANGTITSAGYDGAYGNKTVDDASTTAPSSGTATRRRIGVSVGETVSAGQLIGYVGATGNITGPHLHLEVRPGGGDPVDPYQALVVHGLQP